MRGPGSSWAGHLAGAWTAAVIAVWWPTSSAWAQAAECPSEPCASVAAEVLPLSQVRAEAAGVHQHKQAFVEGLRDFTRAQAGVFGDEGELLRSSLDAMRRALGRWDRAIGELEASVARARRDPEALVALAAVYLDRHRPADALRELEAAARLGTAGADILVLQGLAYGLMDRPADAARALERAVALDAAGPSAAYLLVQQRRALGHRDEARKALEQFSVAATAAPPGPGGIRFERVDLLRQAAGVAPVFALDLYADGYEALERGDYGAALAAFERAVARDPLTSGPAGVRRRIASAAAVLRRGDVEGAVAQLRRSVAEYPADAELRRILALAYLVGGQAGHSVEHLATALGLDAGNERAHMALADVLAEAGHTDRAERELRSATAMFPRSGAPHYRLGLLLQAQTRYPEAIAAFEQSAARGPIIGRDRLYQTIGALRANQADFEGAVEAYARRVDVNPNGADAHRQLAEIYFLQGRDAEALAEFVAAALVAPSDPRAFAGMGQVLLRTRLWADAVDALRHAVTLGGGDAETRYGLGTALLRLGRADEGREQIALSQRLQAEAMAAGQRAFELEARLRQGAAALAAGDVEQGLARLRDAVAFDPSSARAHRELGLALVRASRPAEAIASLLEAESLDASLELAAHLAAAYEAAGNRSEASRHQARAARQARDARLRRLRALAGEP